MQANGFILLHQALQGQSPFLGVVQRIVKDTLQYSMSADLAHFEVDGNGKCSVGQVYPAILMHSTANNNKNALSKYSDCGYICAEYYWLELGNKLLRMGLA